MIYITILHLFASFSFSNFVYKIIDLKKTYIIIILRNVNIKLNDNLRSH